MKVAIKSSLSGIEHTLDIDVTNEQLGRIYNRRANGELIQNIVPHLHVSKREFLISGITEEEWDSMIHNDDGISIPTL